MASLRLFRSSLELWKIGGWVTGISNATQLKEIVLVVPPKSQSAHLAEQPVATV
jgi:hypothetical protein